MPPRAAEELADVLIRAIEANRERINAESVPFVGRLRFHVDMDANVTMHHAEVTLRPCRERESLASS